jgi:hypothetical protein
MRAASPRLARVPRLLSTIVVNMRRLITNLSIGEGIELACSHVRQPDLRPYGNQRQHEEWQRRPQARYPEPEEPALLAVHVVEVDPVPRRHKVPASALAHLSRTVGREKGAVGRRV